MKFTARDFRTPQYQKKSESRAGTLSQRAKAIGMPVGTLKTRIKKLMDSGIERERAIEIALSRPVGPQGRPRKSTHH
jgi:DNA-binding Lrp family transcriptional regulator